MCGNWQELDGRSSYKLENVQVLEVVADKDIIEGMLAVASTHKIDIMRIGMGDNPFHYHGLIRGGGGDKIVEWLQARGIGPKQSVAHI